jgi:threonine dehydrogenase-like Zn-dependent dehydrogenase
MKANCWISKNKVRVEEVPDPKILNSHDAIVRITSTAICGSDLHLYNGFIPSMEKGDILGHEFMGEVVEVSTRRFLTLSQMGVKYDLPHLGQRDACISSSR